MALYLASFPRRETQVQKDSDLDTALAQEAEFVS